ncbi:MAG TPA: serine hydrolase domain-containing protein [Draconibacterium sp.]|nr:serine hydrolase domain-containing protein [Draconibacterium sp.]
MITRFRILTLFFVLFALTNCKKTENNIVYDSRYIEEIKQVRKELGFYVSQDFIPGLQIAISKNGKLIYSEAIGTVSKDLEVEADRDNKFRIGTLSELFTSLIYLKMVEDGTLHPDSTVRHYLPDFPEKRFPIKIKTLVSHTSGIRQMTIAEKASQALYGNIKTGLDVFKDDPLMWPPGSNQQQSRYNYNLLGAIMEETSGKKFSELLTEYVTDTLQFNNTCVDHPFGTIKGRTNFYDHNLIAQVINALTKDLSWRQSADGILSSAEDLIKLGDTFLNSDYLSEETRKNLFTPTTLLNNQKTQLANGWIIFTDNLGETVYGREGSVVGGSASIMIVPKDELIIAITTNLTQETANSPIVKIAGIFMTQPETPTE